MIGWDEIYRGRVKEAHDLAHELMQVGRLLNDPRSTGFGLNLLSWIAFFTHSYAEALEYSDQSVSVAVTLWDRVAATLAKVCALMLSAAGRRGRQALGRAAPPDRSGWRYLYTLVPIEPMHWACTKSFAETWRTDCVYLRKLLSGTKSEGFQSGADWCRVILAEVYLEIIAGKEKPRFVVLLKNLPILLKIVVTAPSRIRALITHAVNNAQFDPNSPLAGEISK